MRCGTLRTTLAGWLKGRKKAMPFGVPRVWREQKNHHSDCYFYMIDIKKYRKANGRQALQYPDIPSSTAPVSHDDSLPVPQPPQNVSIVLIILPKSLTFNLIKHEVFTMHLFFNELLNATVIYVYVEVAICCFFLLLRRKMQSIFHNKNQQVTVAKTWRKLLYQ